MSRIPRSCPRSWWALLRGSSRFRWPRRILRRPPIPSATRAPSVLASPTSGVCRWCPRPRPRPFQFLRATSSAAPSRSARMASRFSIPATTGARSPTKLVSSTSTAGTAVWPTTTTITSRRCICRPYSASTSRWRGLWTVIRFTVTLNPTGRRGRRSMPRAGTTTARGTITITRSAAPRRARRIRICPPRSTARSLTLAAKLTASRRCKACARPAPVVIRPKRCRARASSPTRIRSHSRRMPRAISSSPSPGRRRRISFLCASRWAPTRMTSAGASTATPARRPLPSRGGSPRFSRRRRPTTVVAIASRLTAWPDRAC